MAWILKLTKHSLSANWTGSSLYRENCAGCHGEKRTGRPPDFPSLIGIADRLSAEDMEAKITGGGGRMPTFGFLGTERIAALSAYLRTGVDASRSNSPEPAPNPAQEVVYTLEDLPKFTDPDGYPAISPPWGTLNALNLNTGRYAWKIPFGEFPELAAKGLKNTGTENYGGPIVTAGGLLFIGATSFDKKFHAYDKRTGKLLWDTILPAAGIATPATYRAHGRQFVVIAAGGGRPQQSKPGGKLVAFALSD
jgi:quinoprotein glucose dehydrogenase